MELLGRIPARRPATLRDHARVMDPSIGYYTVVPSPGHTVEGTTLDDLTPLETEALDRYEGVAEGEYRREETVVHVGGEEVRADVYVRSMGRGRGGEIL